MEKTIVKKRPARQKNVVAIFNSWLEQNPLANLEEQIDQFNYISDGEHMKEQDES